MEDSPERSLGDPSATHPPTSEIEKTLSDGSMKNKKMNPGALNDLGGIDFNAANLNLQIKRDGKGVPLPMMQQDMASLSHLDGLVPVILEIKPALEMSLLKGDIK